MRHLTLTIILLAATLFASASESINFKHFTMKDGLANNQVNDIMRDSKGFLWVSTSHGLSRYDGYEFKNFIDKKNEATGLPYYDVESTQEDSRGLIWISFGAERYTCYNPVKEIFMNAGEVLSDSYRINGSPRLIFVDVKSDLWVNTKDGKLYHYDAKEHKTSTVCYPYRKEVRLTDICDSPDGVTAICSDGSFFTVSRKNNTVGKRNDCISKTKQDNQAAYWIFCDPDGDYWIKKQNEAWFYLTETDKLTNLTSDTDHFKGKHTKSFTSDRHGNIWVAIENGGIDIINKKEKTINHLSNDITDSRSLSDNSVQSLYTDTDGGIWVGTFKHGLSYYNEKLFKFRIDNFHEFHNIKNFNPDVSAITEDLEGNLWFGILDGVIKVDQKTKKKELFEIKGGNPHVTIIDMTIDRNGVMWLSTYNHGVLRYDGKSFQHQLIEPDNPSSVANRIVWTIERDKSGYLWLGTWGAGLYGIDPDNGKIKSYNDYRDGFYNSEIASICISSDNNIYLGTTYGIDVYNPVSGKYQKLLGNRSGSQPLRNQQIIQLFEDSRDLLWICTREGVNIYDRRSDEIIQPVPELYNAIIYGVVEDNFKNIWAITSEGLFYIVINNDPHTQSYTFSYHSYNHRNSYENFEFNHKGIYKHRSGVIVTGSINGICLINPSELKYDTTAPNINFTNFQLFNRDIHIDSVYDGRKILDRAPAFAKELVFNYDQNVFSVEFSAMNYISPGTVSYMYMLEGFDPDWMRSTSNKLTYTNLAPGEYTLKVRGVNNDGYSSDHAAELRIIVKPPFWLSWKAYILYGLILAGVILLVRMYLRHNQNQKYELLKIQQEARQKHELDDMKLRFFTNISHELRTPLTLILTPLEYVISHLDNGELKDKLELARNNAMRLLGLVNQLLDFRKSDTNGLNLNLTRGNIVESIRTICDNFMEYSEHRNISLTFFSSAKLIDMMFDQDKINKIMMNLLSNAFKFTPEGGRVDVSLDLLPATDDTPETLEIKVADNGCGISDEHKDMIFDRFYQVPLSNGTHSTGSGIGLNLVKEFVTLHKGTVTVCDNVGKGTVFIISLPVVKPDVTENEDITAATTGAQPPVTAEEHESESAKEDAPESDNKRPVILIVDDNDDFRHFMKDCLKSCYDICEASDGNKAWQMIPDLQPDVIVSDVMMPGMDGNELCRSVKTDIRTSHIPVILLTARTAKEHELKGLENGADDYITKPFNLKILTQRIKNLLAFRQDSRRKAIDVSPSKISITPLDEKLMKKAIGYVEANMERSDLSVEELAGELGMSRVHLYKKLVAITGKTPVEFIRIIRLKRAAQLLAESQLNIAEVTYQTGFNNLSLFRKYFKNEFGVLPSEYQAKHGKKYNETI